ncbi:hypothetical protein [Paenibacillus sp. V4I5]|uniref:hypothetical protein n=1 Tax=unclassified Paenibacillus TaxID=185978 RepID=UPI0027D842C1|nr:hypothetical protein [Paenibacillus sp. V4I5]
MNFAKDGTDILIQNGWLEQPPQAAERDKLAKSYSNHTMKFLRLIIIESCLLYDKGR